MGHARDIGALRDQMIVLSDKGLAGREMERYAADQIHVLLARPDRKDERRRFGNLAGMRQWIEATIGTLKDQLSLERHGGGTPAGVFARVAQRLLAMAACIWHDWHINPTGKRSLIIRAGLRRPLPEPRPGSGGREIGGRGPCLPWRRAAPVSANPARSAAGLSAPMLVVGVQPIG